MMLFWILNLNLSILETITKVNRQHQDGFKLIILVAYILQFGIDVRPLINLGPGKIGKNVKQKIKPELIKNLITVCLRLSIFHFFDPYLPTVSNFLVLFVGKFGKFFTHPARACRRLKWMVPILRTPQKLIKSQNFFWALHTKYFFQFLEES